MQPLINMEKKFLMWVTCICLFWLISATANTNSSSASNTTITEGANITKPNCPRRCGNLTVPYPFGIGIGSGCAIGEWFEVNCSTAFNPPRAFISTTYIEIYNISDNQMRISNIVAKKCYNESGFVDGYRASTNITGSPFSFSESNKFTMIGCDDYAYMMGAQDIENFTIGCVSQCYSSEAVLDGYCSGIGCCQTAVPKSLKYYDSSVNSFNNHSGIVSFNPCGYAFLGEQERFTFRGVEDFLDTNFTKRIRKTVPIVLDWAISNRTCDEAQFSSDYACRSNSSCVDAENGLGGYRCSCNEGFRGNPYLHPGCEDIDECADPNSNNCEKICINTPGGFNCSCPHGNYGDGFKDGRGCIANSSTFPVIKYSLGLCLGIGMVSTSFFWLYKFTKKRKKKRGKEKFFKRNGGLLLQQQILIDECILEKTRLFTIKELEKATDLFNESRILGQGGQGTVYKGMLSDGKTVAVKKSKKVNENQAEQFINEIVMLSQIIHRNVVKLLGCCLETEVPLLVYEFIPNGTLFDLIHDESREFPFSWNMRLKFAIEVAEALAYLHSATSIPIYHRDIKSTNILLDEKYVAKVADFGISRSIAVDQTHLSTLVKGTFGYLDPEYFQSSQFTEKSDVYSFGIVLIELLTGQRPISLDRTEEERSLATKFLSCMERKQPEAILDIQILEQDKREELNAVAKLAQMCLNLNGKKRPTMKEVAIELGSIKMCKMLSIASDTMSQGTHLRMSKSIMTSNDDYTWTSTQDKTIPSSSASPLKIHTY